jgi:hypothetical protein
MTYSQKRLAIIFSNGYSYNQNDGGDEMTARERWEQMKRERAEAEAAHKARAKKRIAELEAIGTKAALKEAGYIRSSLVIQYSK